MAIGIEDLVVNSVALAFILQIDELLCSELLGSTIQRLQGGEGGAKTWIRSDPLVSQSVCFLLLENHFDL